MRRYQSQRRVQAGRIYSLGPLEQGKHAVFVEVDEDTDDSYYISEAEAGRIVSMAQEWALKNKVDISGGALQHGYLVVYEGGYVTWLPADVFTEGYKLQEPGVETINLRGYRKLTPDEVGLANRISEMGDMLNELVIDVREANKDNPGLEFSSDANRWTSVGQTHLQQGLMALKRAVTKPTTFS